MVMDLLNTLELVELSFVDDFLEKYPEKDQEKDVELREHQADHGIKDAQLGTWDSSFDSGKDHRDKLDLDYNPYRDR